MTRNPRIAAMTKHQDSSALAASRRRRPFMGNVSVAKALLQNFRRNTANDTVPRNVGSDNGSRRNDRTTCNRHAPGDYNVRADPDVVADDDRPIDVVER